MRALEHDVSIRTARCAIGRMSLADGPEKSDASAAGFTVFPPVSSSTIKHFVAGRHGAFR